MLPDIGRHAVSRQAEYDVIAGVCGRRSEDEGDKRASRCAAGESECKLKRTERRGSNDDTDAYRADQTGAGAVRPEACHDAGEYRQGVDRGADEQEAESTEAESAENKTDSHLR